MLLDVGTEPDTHGIVNLIKSFRDPIIGGATGLMSVDSNFISEEESTDPVKKPGCFKNFFYSV